MDSIMGQFSQPGILSGAETIRIPQVIPLEPWLRRVRHLPTPIHFCWIRVFFIRRFQCFTPRRVVAFLSLPNDHSLFSIGDQKLAGRLARGGIWACAPG